MRWPQKIIQYASGDFIQVYYGLKRSLINILITT